MARDSERFIDLVCRELGAVRAFIVDDVEADATEEPAAAESLEHRRVRFPMSGGQAVVAEFDQAPTDWDAKVRRLEMLVSAFDAVAIEPYPTRRSRPPAALSLREELEGLCTRAGAVNALVVDANSPVVWGAAHPAGIVEVPPLPSGPSLAAAAARDGGEGDAAAVARQALRVVRGLPEMAALRKGKPLRYVQRSGDVPLIAHAFASIYLLVVVFESGKAFDELRAERAIAIDLPRIERLVLALPPHDPEPTQGAGVIAMRRPRRR